MAVNPTAALISLAVDIDKQIAVIREQAQGLSIPVEYLKYSDGRYVMVELLLAKAQVLNGLAVLKAASK